MVTGIVLANVKRGAVSETAQALLALEGVSEVHSVAGKWDLVVIIRTKDNDALADLVTEGMLKVDGIIDTETLIGFRAYSNYQMDRMFSLGADQ